MKSATRKGVAGETGGGPSQANVKHTLFPFGFFGVSQGDFEAGLHMPGGAHPILYSSTKKFTNFISAGTEPKAVAILRFFGKKLDQLLNHITIKIVTKIYIRGLQWPAGLQYFPAVLDESPFTYFPLFNTDWIALSAEFFDTDFHRTTGHQKICLMNGFSVFEGLNAVPQEITSPGLRV